MIIEKIESSILNGLGYIVRLEKKNGNKDTRLLEREMPKNTHLSWCEMIKNH
ncbi:MAG: hypothetical protein E7I76_03095 [Anaerococcus vaginalis]|uniref:hypothetical protein n=1 Tax=Anaerococcus vaginalis TaxID=33037 RepID=UPI00291082BF|nr:hypothetical protein [Anaerococcus vaginalis]MDU4446975.1 hypothetical protein [Anaerococcus vaginalis]MDU6182645.1 hypothetical protein [Anaerococcus vaginalis]MDU7433101.1 hypothetical protein [Anaerococcus vaginalis]